MDEIDSRAANVHAAELAAIQHGLISATQARALGMAKAAVQRRVKAGHWTHLRRGVYAFAGALRTRERDILEACLGAGPRAVVSGFTAAELWKLPDVWGRPGISLSVPRGVRRSSKGARLTASEFVEHPDDTTTLDGVPITSVARTYVELAEHLPEPVLARSITQAIRKKLLDPKQLVAAIKRGGSPAALQRLETILAASPWQQVFRSKDEQRAYQILHDTGLPNILTNEPVEYAGIYVGEIDVLLPDLDLAIEIDGPMDHSTEEARLVDKVRTLAYRSLGLRVLRFAADRLRDPEDFMRAVARELHQPTSSAVSEEPFQRLWAQWTRKYADPNLRAPRRAAEAAARWTAGHPEPLPWLRFRPRPAGPRTPPRRAGSGRARPFTPTG